MSKVVAFLPRVVLFGVMVVVGLHRQLGRRAGAPGPVAAVGRDRGTRLRAGRRAGHARWVARARRVQRRAVGLARGPRVPRAGRPHRRRRQRPRRRAGGLQEPVGLPAHPADLAVRRRPVPGRELHADLGRDAGAARRSGSSPPARRSARSRTTRTAAPTSTTSTRPCGAATASRCRPGSCGPSSSRTCSRRATAPSSRATTAKIPRGAAPAEGLPRRPRDLPRRLLPGQPRQGDPGGLLRDRPAGPPALGLRGRLVAGVGRRRLRDGVRRRDPHPGDVGATRRAASRPRWSDPTSLPIPHGGGGAASPRPSPARRPSRERRRRPCRRSSSPATAPPRRAARRHADRRRPGRSAAWC